MPEIFHSRPHHAFQEINRGKNNPSTPYSNDPNEELLDQRLNESFWELPDETILQFSQDGQQDLQCQSCHLHPDRYENSLRNRDLIRRGWPICNIERTNRFDQKIFEEIQTKLGDGDITLGDFRNAFSKNEEGHFYTKMILGSNIPDSLLVNYPELQSFKKRILIWREDS